MEDCYLDLEPGPADASALRSETCTDHGIRGSAWCSSGDRIGSQARAYSPPDKRTWGIGLRVLREM